MQWFKSTKENGHGILVLVQEHLEHRLKEGFGNELADWRNHQRACQPEKSIGIPVSHGMLSAAIAMACARMDQFLRVPGMLLQAELDRAGNFRIFSHMGIPGYPTWMVHEENPMYKWTRTGCTPVFGNLHMPVMLLDGFVRIYMPRPWCHFWRTVYFTGHLWGAKSASDRNNRFIWRQKQRARAVLHWPPLRREKCFWSKSSFHLASKAARSCAVPWNSHASKSRNIYRFWNREHHGISRSCGTGPVMTSLPRNDWKV